MPTLSIPTFRGELPIRAAHFLDDTQSVTASNCYFEHGTLQPFSDIKVKESDVLTTDVKSFYDYYGTWKSWNVDVDVIASPIGNDEYERIYFTGMGAPQYLMNTGAEFKLGISRPETEVSIEVKGTGDSGDDITEIEDDESRFYAYTYVSATGEEGPLSPPSDLVTITRPKTEEDADGQYVILTLPALDDSAGLRNITLRRIYRTVTTSSGGDWLLVDEVDITDTTYTDEKLTVYLGAALVTETFYPPSENMIGITALPNGISAGFEGNVVALSEPSLPYAWNPNNQLITDSPVTGIAALASGAVVVTEGQPYLMQGYTPDSMQLVKLDVPYGCNHKNSIVDIGEQVVYASDVGLVAAGSSGAQVVTESVIDKAQWAKYVSGDVSAYRWANNYLMFYKDGLNFSGCILFSLSSGDITVLPMYYKAGWQPEGSDTLYLANGVDVEEVVPGAGTGDSIWKSKEWHTPPISFNSMRLNILSGSATVRCYRDNKLISTHSSSDFSRIFRLPAGMGSRHQFEIETSGNVESLTVATSVQELLNG